MISSEGYKVANIDVSLCLERPKVNPYISKMKSALCPILGIEESDLSIKATTSEKMGFVGREEGVEAHAVALIYQD